MKTDLKSVKLPFAAWQALTRICAETGEPRTKALERIVLKAEKEERHDDQSNQEVQWPQADRAPHD